MHVPIDTAAAIAGVKPATIRQWVHRQHLTQFVDGFDVHELLIWIDTIRNAGQARGAVVAAHVRYQSRRPD